MSLECNIVRVLLLHRLQHDSILHFQMSESVSSQVVGALHGAIMTPGPTKSPAKPIKGQGGTVMNPILSLIINVLISVHVEYT